MFLVLQHKPKFHINSFTFLPTTTKPAYWNRDPWLHCCSCPDILILPKEILLISFFFFPCIKQNITGKKQKKTVTNDKHKEEMHNTECSINSQKPQSNGFKDVIEEGLFWVIQQE